MKGAILKPRTESIDFYLKDIRPPKLVLSKQKETELTAVSYTHLTLPTILRV